MQSRANSANFLLFYKLALSAGELDSSLENAILLFDIKSFVDVIVQSTGFKVNDLSLGALNFRHSYLSAPCYQVINYIMKYILEFFAILSLFIIQTVFSRYLEIFNAKPDFIFLYLCFRSFSEGPTYGSALGFLLGLLQSLYSPMSLGAASFAKTIVGFSLGRGGNTFVRTAIGLRLGAIFIAFIAHDIIFYLFIDPASLLHILFYYSLPGAIYTVAIGAIISLFRYFSAKLLPG